MSTRPKPRITARKAPKQARSTELVASILEAAAQVLAQEGAARFTTARVAERAGVSVGSIYQYFPNKAAILFRLQVNEWHQTTALLIRLLEEPGLPPFTRLSNLVRAFIQSECAEAPMRIALDDAAPLYRDAPETREIRIQADQACARFMAEALPTASAATRQRATELITISLSAGGKAFSSQPRSAAEIDAFTQDMAAMFCAYLTHLNP
ncbi:MAG: TetR family transcriptional regulator [Rhodocyclales bacterium]|nr:TetR family transcriptional regulator [Rhodocyclales bacterium]